MDKPQRKEPCKIKSPFANEEDRYLTNRTRHYKNPFLFIYFCWGFFFSSFFLYFVLFLFIFNRRTFNIFEKEIERHLNDDFDEMIAELAGICAMHWWNEMAWIGDAILSFICYCFFFVVVICLVRFLLSLSFSLSACVSWIFLMAMNWSFQVADKVWPSRLCPGYVNSTWVRSNRTIQRLSNVDFFFFFILDSIVRYESDVHQNAS